MDRGWNFSSMFRFGTGGGVRYRSRPLANRQAARSFWDHMAEGGPIEWIMLLDGYWGCKRPGDDLVEEHEAVHYRREW